MSAITIDSLATNEAIPARSRTFPPEVVARIHALFTGEAEDVSEPVQNVGIGTFEKEGAARSALTTLNRLLKEQHGHTHAFASTVRQVDGGYKAILVNKPAKEISAEKLAEMKRKREAKKAQKAREAAKKAA